MFSDSTITPSQSKINASIEAAEATIVRADAKKCVEREVLIVARGRELRVFGMDPKENGVLHRRVEQGLRLALQGTATPLFCIGGVVDMKNGDADIVARIPGEAI